MNQARDPAAGSSQLKELLRDAHRDALDKFIANRCTEISDRVKRQHQITVAAGVIVAVAAGFLGRVDPQRGAVIGALALPVFLLLLLVAEVAQVVQGYQSTGGL